MRNVGSSRKGRLLSVLALAGLTGVLMVGYAFSAERGARRGGRRRFDPARFRQLMQQRTKEALGATDEEWKVLGPRVQKVQTLSAGLRVGRMSMWGRGRRRPRAADDAAPERERTALEKAAEALREILAKEDAKPEDIRVGLKAYREAREKARQELAKAQGELREIVTARQEAQLVLMGLLE